MGSIKKQLETCKNLLKSELSNPFQCYLSLSAVCVYLFIYTISISITCVSLEESNPIAFNQQIWLLQVNNF